ncbi:hypothetical protein ES703_85647 [subsurface metagenome]
MDAGRCVRSKIEVATGGHNKLVAFLVVISEQVLSAAHVTKVQQDVLIADRPEIGTRPVVANQRVPIIFNERVQIFPFRQIFRAKQKIGPYPLTSRAVRQGACRKRVIHAAFFPDARIEHPVRRDF